MNGKIQEYGKPKGDDNEADRDLKLLEPKEQLKKCKM